jgi:hypothetical protein
MREGDGMKPVDMSEFFWGVSPEDSAVVNAMEVYDHLDEVERRNVYRSMILAMTAFRRENNPGRLVGFIEGIERMIRMDAVPGFREKLRAQRNAPPPEPCDPVDMQALIRRLESGDL